MEDLQKDYRFLIFKKYKIVYYFNERASTIEIHDVFNSRQNLIKITRRKQLLQVTLFNGILVSGGQ